ncbi:hypothetical protein AB1N83_012344 [Pleurotus pulmonarius]
MEADGLAQGKPREKGHPKESVQQGFSQPSNTFELSTLSIPDIQREPDSQLPSFTTIEWHGDCCRRAPCISSSTRPTYSSDCSRVSRALRYPNHRVLFLDVSGLCLRGSWAERDSGIYQHSYHRASRSDGPAPAPFFASDCPSYYHPPICPSSHYLDPPPLHNHDHHQPLLTTPLHGLSDGS